MYPLYSPICKYVANKTASSAKKSQRRGRKKIDCGKYKISTELVIAREVFDMTGNVGDETRIGKTDLFANLAAQVLGHTGTLFGRTIAKMVLSVALGENEESLRAKIGSMDQKTLIKIADAYQRAIAGSSSAITPQMQEIHKLILEKMISAAQAVPSQQPSPQEAPQGPGGADFPSPPEEPYPQMLESKNRMELLKSLQGTTRDFPLKFSFQGQDARAWVNQWGGVSIRTAEGMLSISKDDKFLFNGDAQYAMDSPVAQLLLGQYSSALTAALDSAKKATAEQTKQKTDSVATETKRWSFGRECQNNLLIRLHMAGHTDGNPVEFEYQGTKGRAWANGYGGVTIQIFGRNSTEFAISKEGMVFVGQERLSSIPGKVLLLRHAPFLHAALQAAKQSVHQEAQPTPGPVTPYYTAQAQSQFPPPKKIIPFNVPLTVAVSLTMLDRHVTKSDADRALALEGSPADPAMWASVRPRGQNLHSPLVRAVKVPHEPITGLEIMIPKSRLDIAKRLQEEGFTPQLSDPQLRDDYPMKFCLDQRQMERLLALLDIPLADIHKARPTTMKESDVRVSEEWRGGLAVKGWHEEEIPDNPNVQKDDVIGFFAAKAPKLKDKVTETWKDAEKEGEAGKQTILIFKAIVAQLRDKQELTEADQKLLADTAEAMDKTCFAARCTELEGAYQTWQRGQTGKGGGASELQRILTSVVQDFKEGLLPEIVKDSPESVHAANYLKQRWTTLFEFRAPEDHAAWQGPEILRRLRLNEQSAAQQFANMYTASDPTSPYPNKSILFRQLYEKLLGTQLQKNKPIWGDPDFVKELMSVAGHGLTAYLLKMKNFTAQGLRPEGAELYFISLGLLPGNVEQKKAELTAKMQYEIISEATDLWNQELQKGDGADKDKLFEHLDQLIQSAQLSDDQIAAFLQSVGIHDQQALENLLGEKKCEDLLFSFPAPTELQPPPPPQDDGF